MLQEAMIGRIHKVLFILAFIFYTISFGAIHTEVLSFFFAVFALLLLPTFHKNTLRSIPPRAIRGVSLLSFIYMTFIGYIFVSQLFFEFDNKKNILEFYKLLLPHLATLTIAFNFFLVLTKEDNPKDFFSKTIIALSVIVSLIALSHWFIDNGKLFWVFSPTHIMTTARARWPFVNPNHLAASLFIPLCLASYYLEKNTLVFIEHMRRRAKSKNFHITHFLGQKENQTYIFSMLTYTIPVFLAILCIIASQSRNGYIGLALFFLLLLLRTPEQPTTRKTKREKQKVVDVKELEVQTTSNQFKSKKTKKNILLISFFLVLASLFVIFSPKGIELVSSRIDYGVKKSSSDIRLSLYKNSLNMLFIKPLTGIGPNNWSKTFPQFQKEPLERYSPQYLHSDIYQYLIEYGLIGAILLISGVLVIIRIFLKNKAPGAFYYQLGLLLSVLFSFFDFPFHIPAIHTLFFITIIATIYSLNREAIDVKTESQ